MSLSAKNRDTGLYVRVVWYLLLIIYPLCHPAQLYAQTTLHADTRINEQDILTLFPRATFIGDEMHDPPVWPVYQLQELIGYAFESRHLTNYSGFSGDPINLLIGIDPNGLFTGVSLIDHHEPIFLHGLGPQPLIDYLKQYQGIRLSDRIILKKPGSSTQNIQAGTAYFDAVTKATVSIIVVNDTALSSALKVARKTLEEFAQQLPATVKQDLYSAMTWRQMLEQGLVKQWKVGREDVESALGRELNDYPEGQLSTTPEAETIHLYFAYLNAPNVGKNLLGDTEFNRLLEQLRQDESAVLLMSTGFYDIIDDSFKPGTIPERFNLLQNGLPIPIRDLNFYNYQPPSLIEGAPDFSNTRIFRIRPRSGFDPSAAMNLQLLFNLQVNHLIRDQATLTSPYQLPAHYFERREVITEQAPLPVWVRIWQGRAIQIAILMLALILLVVIFVRQQTLLKTIRQFYLIRWSFLLFTLFFIGFYAQGQLSVVNIFTLLTEILKGFDLAVFLLDPIIFILWTFTFITLFIWGRGVFCGWLCPFGALQEMVAWLASKLEIKQWKIRETLHRKMLNLKYLILLVLTGISLYSLNTAMLLSEVEPFKTSITLFFIRTWPFVFYAVILLGLGFYINKFYCRYVCPLGGGLALVGKFHLLEKLRRRNECGSKCQMCRNRCQVNAIHTNGSIDYTECIQCLECLVIINDPKQCAIDLLSLKQTAKFKLSSEHPHIQRQ